MYGNAAAQDFWDAQTKISGKPIDRVMSSFITEPGVPLLQFSTPKSRSTTVSQQRFFLDPEMHAEAQTWTVPVCFKTGSDPKCELLSSSQQSLSIPSADVFYANANDRGYYRTEYDAADTNKILSTAETNLTSPERIGFAGNEWALMRSGRSSIVDTLHLVSELRNDSNAAVIDELAGSIAAVDARIATPDDRKLLAAWVRQQFGPAYGRVKDATTSDPLGEQQLRATLFSVLGEIGRDPQILSEAQQLTEKYIADPSSVDPSLARPAIYIATQNGDSHLFDQLQQLSKTSNDPGVQTTALFALANFHDPVLVRRALDYATSGQVRNQDSVFLFVYALRNRDTRPAAWDYMQKNWDKVHAQLTTMMGAYLVNATGSFCSEDKSQEVHAFFTAHPVEAAQRAVHLATDAIHDCTVLRAAQQPKLTTWLSGQNLGAAQ